MQWQIKVLQEKHNESNLTQATTVAKMNLPHNFQVSNFAMLFFFGSCYCWGWSNPALLWGTLWEVRVQQPCAFAASRSFARRDVFPKKYRRKTQLVANFTGFTGVRCAEKLWQEIEGFGAFAQWIYLFLLINQLVVFPQIWILLQFPYEPPTHTHTLAQNSPLRILMWNASYVQKHSN